AAESLNAALLLVNQLMGQVRQLSLDLRPAMLDDLGLVPALRWLFDRFGAQTGVSVKFESAGLDGRLPTPIETTAYRIIQEALTNVARHSQVSEVVVRVRADSSRLTLEVQDEGIGFDPGPIYASKSGCGLTGMRERCALLGGALRIESASGA